MTRTLLLNIVLMFVWVALTGNFSFGNYLFGYWLSFGVMWVSGMKGDQNRAYFVFIPRLIGFVLYFLYELLKANLQVAYEVMTPQFTMKPGIIQVPLDASSDLEITLLANLITLTPGTLSLDVSTDKKVLYVHAMYVTDKDSFIKSIKNGFEKRILQLTR
jgi:multicomponent Na+:H+ antiporter subunit E